LGVTGGITGLGGLTGVGTVTGRSTGLGGLTGTAGDSGTTVGYRVCPLYAQFALLCHWMGISEVVEHLVWDAAIFMDCLCSRLRRS
jgi:hypothetical protein